MIQVWLKNMLLRASDTWEHMRALRVEKFTLYLYIIFFLSCLDAAFTLAWIKTDLAVEANPLLVVLLDHGDAYFVLTKIFLTFAGCLILFAVKHTKSARIVIGCMLFLYVLLTGYHFFGAWSSIDFMKWPPYLDKVLS